MPWNFSSPCLFDTALGTTKTQFYIILTHVLSLANACEKREGDAKKKEGKGGAYDLFF